MERDEAVLIVSNWPLTKGAKEIIMNSLRCGDADAVSSVMGHLEEIGRLLEEELSGYPTLTNSNVAFVLRDYLDDADLYPETQDLIDCWAIAIALMSKGFNSEAAVDFASQNVRLRRK